MKVREITVSCIDAAHGERVVDAVSEIDGVTVESVLDRTFQMHQGGKIHVGGNIPVKTRDDLSMAYTPGVARVCSAIHDVARAGLVAHRSRATLVAVVSDGTAVLGLGDIGPEAAMPVMEGKALLFKEFAGVDAFPLCLDTTDVDEIVAIVTRVGPGVRRHQPGGHLGAAPTSRSSGGCASGWTSRCSTTTSTAPRSCCSRRCATPLRVVGKRVEDVADRRDGRRRGRDWRARTSSSPREPRTSSCATSHGALYSGRPELDPERAALAERTNPGR